MINLTNYTKSLSLIFCLAALELAAGIMDHIRILEDKPFLSPMRNIDYIYMINLDERPQKYEQSLNELAPYGIVPYRFSAVNGWELPLEIVNDIGVKYDPWMRQGLMGTCYLPEDEGEPRHEIMQVPGRNYFCHCMSRGAVGILMSHLSILVDAYKAGYETVWVMEDDIRVIRNPHLISDRIESLDRLIGKNSWDFLFTDYDTKNKRGEYVPCLGCALRPNFSPALPNKFNDRFMISLEFRKVGARYGAYSVIVRRSGMKKMIDFLKNGMFLPYDMEYTLPNDINMYTVLEDIVSTEPNALSDNGAPNYKYELVQP